MSIPSLSFNTLLLVAIIGAFAISFLSGEGRIKKITIGVLVGYLAGLQLGSFVHMQLGHISQLPDLSIGTIRITLLIIAAFLFNLGKVHHVEGRPRVSIESVAVGLITVLFAITAILEFLPNSSREALLTNYNLAAQMYNLRLLWLGLAIGGLILIEVLGGSTKRPR